MLHIPIAHIVEQMADGNFELSRAEGKQFGERPRMKATPLPVDAPDADHAKQYTGIQCDHYRMRAWSAKGAGGSCYKPQVKNGQRDQGEQDAAESTAEQEYKQAEEGSDYGER
jgi:hypothetical protein